MIKVGTYSDYFLSGLKMTYAFPNSLFCNGGSKSNYEERSLDTLCIPIFCHQYSAGNIEDLAIKT